jgi:hypothetical protein
MTSFQCSTLVISMTAPPILKMIRGKVGGRREQMGRMPLECLVQARSKGRVNGSTNALFGGVPCGSNVESYNTLRSHLLTSDQRQHSLVDRECMKM